jgi:NTE family protein
VLVFQGGGALGAYQAGVYQALHEAGIEPDWVIGTSIGAINAALIAGNRPADRMERLDAFWSRVTAQGFWAAIADAWRPLSPEVAQSVLQFDLLFNGLPGFFRPRWLSWANPQLHGEPEQASCYDTTPLRDTLDELIDWSCLGTGPRLTVGAVSVRGGHMRYFDSGHEALRVDHVMASGALPPAFGAVRIDGDVYWDGGICSNTPMERVLNDEHHLPSLVFTTRIWQGHGEAPDNVWATQQRMKDIQFASRADLHLSYERKVNHLRRMLGTLVQDLPKHKPLPEALDHLLEDASVSTYHVIKLQASRLPYEDQGKDIDFSAQGIARRRRDGYETTREALRSRPWEAQAQGGLHAYAFPTDR